jgi:hypothetical protein
VGGTIVREGENVIISDENFWTYTTEDDQLLQWDPPANQIDKDDVLLDLSISDRSSQVEISAIQASGMPNLNVGWSFKVYQSPYNPKGCSQYSLDQVKWDTLNTQSQAIVVNRGECTFLQKIRMAKEAGFELVIVVDSTISMEERFIPSLLTEKGMVVPVDELIPLVLVLGRRDAALIKRADKVRISGTKKFERRMVVRGRKSHYKCTDE